MRKTITLLLVLGLLAAVAAVHAQAPAKPAKPVKKQPTAEEKARKAKQDAKRLDEEVVKMTAALPEKAPAQPKQPRKLLVYSLAKGFPHDSIPLGRKTFEAMGKKTAPSPPRLAMIPPCSRPRTSPSTTP